MAKILKSQTMLLRHPCVYDELEKSFKYEYPEPEGLDFKDWNLVDDPKYYVDLEGPTYRLDPIHELMDMLSARLKVRTETQELPGVPYMLGLQATYEDLKKAFAFICVECKEGRHENCGGNAQCDCQHRTT